jgi:protein disulfide-isomerase-like protein
MVLIKSLVLAGLATLSFASAPLSSDKSDVIDLIPSNFDKFALGGKPALVEFFAPWCGHCKTLAPIYEKLAQDFSFAKDKITIAKVDADSEKSLGKRFGIQGFPTIKYFDGKSETPEDYNGGRDIESLTTFLTTKTGLKPKKKAVAPSQVEMLTDKSFKEQIGGDKDVIVAFTAPWCGRKFHSPLSLPMSNIPQTARLSPQFGRLSPTTSPTSPMSLSPKLTPKPRTPKPLPRSKAFPPTLLSSSFQKAAPNRRHTAEDVQRLISFHS